MNWRAALLPLTPLYAAVVKARAAAYARGLLKSHKLPVPVVSVGNLTFGGTGKTPTVIALVRDLVRTLAGSVAPPPPYDRRIQAVFEHVRAHTEDKILLEDLARRVHLSPGRLGHLFKDQVGVPVRRFLLWARLRRAHKHILRGASLTAAAHEAGFADSAHFSRAYRRLFGVSPSRMLRGRHVRFVICVD